MSTPTGSLAVLDAGDIYAAVRHFQRQYPRATLRDLPAADIRRARNFALAAQAELAGIILRLDPEDDYTRAHKPAPTTTDPEATPE